MKKSSRFLLFGLSTIACVGVTGGILVQKTLDSPAIVHAEASSVKLEFTKKCGGTGTDGENEWAITSDADESDFDKNRGVHYGTGKLKVSEIKAVCTTISGTISKVVVNCSAPSTGDPKVQVLVGETSYGEAQSISKTNNAYIFEGKTAGPITVRVFKKLTQDALYLKSIEVFYTDVNPSSSDSESSSSSSIPETTESPTDTDISSSETSTIKKVMSNDELVDGHYLIVCDTMKAIFDGSLSVLDTVKNNKTVTFSGTEIAMSPKDANAFSFFVAKEEKGNYSIKSSSGLYIGRSSNSNGLETGSTALSNTISIKNGDADIASASAHLRYNSDSNQERFRYFKSSSYTKQKSISLYLVSSSEYQPVAEDMEFTDALLTLLECDATGNVAPSEKDWDDIESTYFDRLSDAGKKYFKTIAANAEGTDAEKAMAKYDYIIGKYGTDVYKDYLGRDIEKTAQAKSYLLGDNKNNSFAIIAGSIFAGAVITIGLFFVLKKKKA